MAWEENSRICLHMQLIAILSRTGVYLYAVAQDTNASFTIVIDIRNKAQDVGKRARLEQFAMLHTHNHSVCLTLNHRSFCNNGYVRKLYGVLHRGMLALCKARLLALQKEKRKYVQILFHRLSEHFTFIGWKMERKSWKIGWQISRPEEYLPAFKSLIIRELRRNWKIWRIFSAI